MPSEGLSEAELFQEFKTKVVDLLNEYAEIIGPDSESSPMPVDSKQTRVTDAIVVVNWMDLTNDETYLSAYPVTKTNPSMVLGMLTRVGNSID